MNSGTRITGVAVAAHHLNIVVVLGVLSSQPRLRTLPSGTELLNCEITTQSAEGPAASVPVAVFDPTASVVDLAQGTEVLVVGQVRRRFFRAGGATVSRTEVVAITVLPATRKKSAQKLLDTVVSQLACAPFA